MTAAGGRPIKWWGLGLADIARLLSWNPARRYGLGTKGTIGIGYDADIALLDPAASHVVRAAESESSQGYTPFEGQELTGKVSHVWLRGQRILADGQVVGSPGGRYQKRPT